MLTAGQAKVKRKWVIVPLANPEVQPYFQQVTGIRKLRLDEPNGFA
jgi:hypothetical protein